MSLGATRSGRRPSCASRSRRRGLAEARAKATLFETIRYATSGQVVVRQFHEHFISLQHADAVLPHLARRVAEHFMPIFKSDAEHGIGKQFDDLPPHFDQLFLCHLLALAVWLRNGCEMMHWRHKCKSEAAECPKHPLYEGRIPQHAAFMRPFRAECMQAMRPSAGYGMDAAALPPYEPPPGRSAGNAG